MRKRGINLKNIMYVDRADGNKRLYCCNIGFRQTKNDRIMNGLIQLKYMGNIDIYFVRNRKYRKIISRGY